MTSNYKKAWKRHAKKNIMQENVEKTERNEQT